MYFQTLWLKHKIGIKLLSFALILMLAIGLMPMRAIANPMASSYSFIESRFILWDSSEKMLDNEFSIIMIDFNSSVNHSSSYEITINENVYNGSFNQFYRENITLNNTEFIYLLEVKINGNTTLRAEDIIIMSGVDGSTIHIGSQPFGITFSPSEWRAIEWSIFFALMLSGFLSIWLAYRVVKFKRIHGGVKEWK